MRCASGVPRDREQQVRRHHLRIAHGLGDAIGTLDRALEGAARLGIHDADRAEQVAFADPQLREQAAGRSPSLKHHQEEVSRRRTMGTALRLPLRTRHQTSHPPTDCRHQNVAVSLGPVAPT